MFAKKKKNTYKKQFFETFLKSPFIFIEKRIVLHFRMWLYFQIPTSMKIQDYYFLEIRHLLLKKEKKNLLWDDNKKTIFFLFYLSWKKFYVTEWVYFYKKYKNKKKHFYRKALYKSIIEKKHFSIVFSTESFIKS